MTIQDVCATQTITILEPNAFTQGPFQYELGDAQSTKIAYDIESLIVPSIYDCGDKILTFINSDDSVMDPIVFSEDRSIQSNFKFIIGAGPLTKVSKAGTYNLKFTMRYAEAPENFEVSSVFVVHIIDPCDPHIAYSSPTFTVPSFLPQEYLISADTKVYTIPEFTVSPSICQTRITYSFNPNTDSSPSIIGIGGSAATFTGVNRQFSFYTLDKNLADPLSGTLYTLTVTASLPSGEFAQGQVLLTLKNPCFITNFVSVHTEQQPTFNYAIYATTPDNIWTLETFTTSTTASIATFCGVLTYQVEGAVDIDQYLTYYSGTHQL